MEEDVNAEVLNNRLDKWLQRAAVTVMVAVGVALLGIGVALYAPRVEAGQAGSSKQFEAAKVTNIETVATAAAK